MSIAATSCELPEVPLEVHATYTRNQIADAFASEGHRLDHRGPLRRDDRDRPAARDAEQDRARFHWESQSSASHAVGAGKRYLEQRSRVLLFLRIERSDPYLFLGRVDLESAQGDKPVAITRRLRTPVPERFQEARSAAS